MSFLRVFEVCKVYTKTSDLIKKAKIGERAALTFQLLVQIAVKNTH